MMHGHETVTKWGMRGRQARGGTDGVFGERVNSHSKCVLPYRAAVLPPPPRLSA